MSICRGSRIDAVDPNSWKPTAGLDALKLRAELLARVRSFFAERGVLEVETPILAAAPVPDLHLESLATRYRGPGGPDGPDGPDGNRDGRLYLQTSPEYAMKRLLAAGSGPIFQISRAFRDGEAGRIHNPEFTLLEWYRPGFDHHRLMDEIDELLGEILETEPAERVRYQEIFRRHLDLDPLEAPVEELKERAAFLGIDDDGLFGHDDWLHILLTHEIEKHLGNERPTFVYDYPASQAALARISPEDPKVAERFEVYVQRLELANGFHELTDAAEQRARFEEERENRRRLGRKDTPLDERFLAALEAGLPPCAGVALGFDRLVMLAAGAAEIDEVIAFPIDRA